MRREWGTWGGIMVNPQTLVSLENQCDKKFLDLKTSQEKSN